MPSGTMPAFHENNERAPVHAFPESELFARLGAQKVVVE